MTAQFRGLSFLPGHLPVPPASLAQRHADADAVADDVFEAAAHGIEIRFARDESGQVTQLELHQAGQVMRAGRDTQ